MVLHHGVIAAVRSHSSLLGRAGATLVCVAAAVTATGCTPGSHGTAATTPTTTASPQPTISVSPTPPAQPAGWRALPSGPAPSQPAGVWTGTEFILDGPQSSRDNVVVGYNPATNTWRKIPSAPYPVAQMEGGEQAVWTGTEMLTFGVQNAAYNPATNTWRPLSPSVIIGPAVTVWTGSQVLMWGGGCCTSSSSDGASYDPVHNKWQKMPSPPLAPRHQTAGAWTGRELIVAGGFSIGPIHGELDQIVDAEAAAYDPVARSWRRLPPLPEPRAGATATWTGSQLLVVGGYGVSGSAPNRTGVAYDPSTNAWHTLPAMTNARADHMAVWTGKQLVVWGGWAHVNKDGTRTTPPFGEAYDPARNSWSALPTSVLRGRTNAIVAWTGHEMIIWGGWLVSAGGGVTDGAAYTPPSSS